MASTLPHLRVKNPNLLQLFSAATPNGIKVAACLEELNEIDVKFQYEPHTINIIVAENRTVDYLAISPTGKVYIMQKMHSLLHTKFKNNKDSSDSWSLRPRRKGNNSLWIWGHSHLFSGEVWRANVEWSNRSNRGNEMGFLGIHGPQSSDEDLRVLLSILPTQNSLLRQPLFQRSSQTLWCARISPSNASEALGHRRYVIISYLVDGIIRTLHVQMFTRSLILPFGHGFMVWFKITAMLWR